jgi:Flp pilus assembly protein TadG
MRFVNTANTSLSELGRRGQRRLAFMRNNKRAEGGQALLLTVLAMTVLVGMTAMAIDVGLLLEDRRHLQNSADAMALAGVQELPLNPIAAMKEAQSWAANNGIRSSQIKTIEVQTKFYPNDTLYVAIVDDFDWVFAKVLGLSSDTVTGDAAALVGSLNGAQGHQMPWALLSTEPTPCLNPLTGDAVLTVPPTSCSVKVGSDASLILGWYGALDFDNQGGGAAEYKGNIIDGTTDTVYCIDGTFAPEPPECESSTINALAGNGVGPTGSGIAERQAAGPACDPDGIDEFDDVFLFTGGTPPYSVACPTSPWLVVIPIVKENQIPVQTVTIEGWLLAYLKGYKCVSSAGPCTAGKGHWEVQIQMVDATFSAAKGYLTAYNPLAGTTVRRLIK